MDQALYDDPMFFTGYQALRTHDTGLNGALEVPALRSLLPPLTGLRVLDLGCGFGDFARWAREEGAQSVLGIDASWRMLQQAEAETADPAISYVRASVEDFEPPAAQFDLVVSSLMFHYVEPYQNVLKKLYDALVPRGRIAFSVEHPVATANPVGWVKNEAAEKLHWPLANYRPEGWRESHWFIDGVRKYHRSVESYVNGLLDAGFVLHRMLEAEPTKEALQARPELESDRMRPPFLFLSAEKR